MGKGHKQAFPRKEGTQGTGTVSHLTGHWGSRGSGSRRGAGQSIPRDSPRLGSLRVQRTGCFSSLQVGCKLPGGSRAGRVGRP